MVLYDDIFMFIKVFESRSYTITAKSLGISQPSIRRHVQNLERSLGKSLVLSTVNKIEISEFGQKIYECFKDRSQELEMLLDGLMKEDPNVAGELKVVLPSALSARLITPYLPDFLQKYPLLKLKLNYTQNEPDIFGAGVDVAVSVLRPTQQSLIVRTLFAPKSSLYCTENYAKKYGTPQSLAEIHQFPIIGNFDVATCDLTMLSHKYTNEVCYAANDCSIALNDAANGIALLQSDQFIVGLEDYEISFSQQDNLIRVLPDYEFVRDKYYLILPSRYKDIKTKVFCQFLDECIQRYEQTKSLANAG